MKTRRQAKMAVALAAPQVLPDATPLATNISSARRHPPLLSQEWVLAAIGEHAASLLRTARRHSLCSDDAQDAYQRAIEIFLRRAPSLERATVVGWLHTVVKHEAHTVRDERQRLLHRSADDLDLQEASDLPTADEQVDRLDRLSYAAEALQRIKPAELRALVLKAEGHSYAEIEAISGWSYTKVNRLLSEGRRRLLDRYAEIESGAECARWSAVLSAMADGEASAKELIAIRPHLRSCRGCQSTLRVYRTAPADVQLLIPVAGLGLLAAAPARGGGLIGRIYELVAGGFYERATLSAAKLQAGLEAASAGKVAAVAATAVVVVGGGAAVIQQVPPPANQSPAAQTAVAKTAPVQATVVGSIEANNSAGPVASAAAARAKTVGPVKASAATVSPAQASDLAAATEFGFEGTNGHSSSPSAATSTKASNPKATSKPASSPAKALPSTRPSSPDASGEFGP